MILLPQGTATYSFWRWEDPGTRWIYYANGLLQPIVVREYEGKYQIVVGERRYRACKLAGITEVPCIIQELDDNQTANAALVENIQRENLSAIEEALLTSRF